MPPSVLRQAAATAAVRPGLRRAARQAPAPAARANGSPRRGRPVATALANRARGGVRSSPRADRAPAGARRHAAPWASARCVQVAGRNRTRKAPYTSQPPTLLSVRFEVVATDPGSGLRAGVLHTAHGSVPTPTFMPVGTLGSVKALSPAD